ncbi:unnamed protein product [Rotaria magnacalcarata]|uniref:Uncharacterized protein n=1 Tax=Rotaria magnacalcarata TaxID=392030 RepID=A0A820L2D2_9BILA|nr:unnamed protein product [Rotaria magnacalcarata]
MQPQYIRFIKSSNQVIQNNISSPATIHLRAVQPVLHRQNTIASVQLLQGVTGVTAATPTRIIINSSPSTVAFTNGTTALKTNNSIIAVPIRETPVNSSSSVVCIPVKESSNDDVKPTKDVFKNISTINVESNLQTVTPPSKRKRISSPRCKVVQRNEKKSSKKLKQEEAGLKILKRKTWTENEPLLSSIYGLIIILV